MTTFSTYLERLLVGPLANAWGRALVRAFGATFDGPADATLDASLLRGPADAPDDALPYFGDDRGLPQLPGESLSSWRARLVAAWETWRWAATTRGIREPLVLLGLRGVLVVPWRTWRMDNNSGLWARFRVYVTGYTSAGELASGALVSGEYLGPGLGIAPLRSGAFVSGEYVSGTTATPETVALVRSLIRTWRPARDRCAAVVFTWGGAISGACRSGHATSGGPDCVSWRGSLNFV